ncbi:MAG: hypothetical protein KDC87_21245 [Planctomycetes bacterium]|nr:hypothetical protein [Planctomycetota bacterium]MCB9868221.1 hypothetical protein [Planctomycetota bacterium]
MPSTDDLTKLRDLLFGEQLRAMQHEIDELRGELSQARDELGALRTELDSQGRIQHAAAERQHQQLTGELADLRGSSVSRGQLAGLLARLGSELGAAGEPPKNGARGRPKDG